MLQQVSYLLTWAWDNPMSLVALAVVILLIIFGFRFALSYGLKAILIIFVAILIMSCMIGVALGGFLLTAEVADQLPSILCTSIKFCPPPTNPGATSTPPPDTDNWPVGYTYEVSHSSGSATLRNGSAVDSAIIAEIPNGTDVCIAEFVASNTIDGRSLRGRVVPGGDNTTTGWVHTAALNSKPLKKCP